MAQPTAGRKRTPIWLVSAAFFICLISSLIAFNQDPHPNAFRPDIPFPQSLVDSDWWRYPREANAFKRLPVIPSTLKDLYVGPDGLKLWAVGNKGLIVHSSDGGKTWEQQNKQAQTAKQASHPQVQAATRQSSSLLNEAHAAEQPDAGNVNQFTKPLAQQMETPTTTSGDSLEACLSRIPSDASAGQRMFAERTCQRDAANRQKIGDTLELSATTTKQKTTAPTSLQPIVNQSIRTKPISKPKSPNPQGATKSEPPPINPHTVDLRGIACVGDLTCWAVGAKGTILETTDGGQAWRTQTSGTTNELADVTFISARQGWAVGEYRILSTEDGGKTWKVQTTKNRLESVTFISARQGWAVGVGSTIMLTRDGGQTWKETRGNGINLLRNVTFVSDRKGWVVGTYGTILATNDGGMTWTSQESGMIGTRGLESVSFISATQGWAGGDGWFLATTDGGKTWTKQPNVPPGSLKKMRFVSPNKGWVVSGGEIFLTTNGGQTWIKQATSGNSLELLYSVDFVSPKEGWAVGWNGMILV